MPYYGNKPPPGAQVDWGNPINRGLVGWWLFNEGAGSRVSDIVGGRDGVLTNIDPASDWVGSPHGGGLNFDGSDSEVNTSLQFPGGYFGSGFLSVSIWMQYLGSPSAGDEKTFVSNEGSFSGPTVAPASDNVGSIIEDGGWHHVVVGVTSDSVVYYVDGIDRGGGSHSAGSKTSFTLRYDPANNQLETIIWVAGADPVRFGNQRGSTVDDFVGVLSNALIYDRDSVLTAQEVQQLFHFPYGGVLRRAVRFVPAAIVTSGPPVSMQIM